MPDRDTALDNAIHAAAAILGDAMIRLLFPESASPPVDLPETESPHVNAG